MNLHKTALKAVLLASGLLVVTAGGVLAQGDNCRCEGYVKDAEGNPVKGATISFYDASTNHYFQPTQTNKKGKWAHNTLRAFTNPGIQFKAELEGWKMVSITAMSRSGTGTSVTDETYVVGIDQAVRTVGVPGGARGADPLSEAKCVVDFVMVPEDQYAQAYHQFKAAKEGGGDTPPPAAAGDIGAAAGYEPPSAPAATPGGSPLEQAQAMIADRNYEGAIAPGRLAVEREPDSAEAHFRLGQALLKTEKVAEAEPELQKAYELDPELTGLPFEMGMLYIAKGRPMQAIPFFEKENEMTPDSPAIIQNLGKLYSDTGQHEKAIEVLEKLIELQPDEISAYAALANAYKQMGDTDKERETYERMGAQDPTGMAFYNLGTLMFNESEMELAAAAYEKAIEQAPDNAMAHYQLGFTYVNLARFADAIAQFEKFMKLAPNDPKAAEAKGLVADLKQAVGG